MDSTADDDPADALAALTRQLRARLAHHLAAGGWAAPGGASPGRPVALDDAGDVDVRAGGVAAVRPAAGVDAPPTAEAESGAGAPVLAGSRRSLAQIREELGACTRCKLHATRQEIVFGVGAEDAPLVFVGEGPGAEEDRTGEPFVGAAGQLLDKMIEAMGWSRATVYIANVVKCRPPGNRNPQPDEVAACRPFLEAQLRATAPRVIVALGRPAASALLGRDAPISALRGVFHDRGGVRVMPTFHPAYLLREPDRKRDVWADLKLVMAELERLGVRAPGSRRG
jgi:DNA polymerase